MITTASVLPAKFSHLSIRSATKADEERVTELVFGVLAEYGLQLDPEITNADLQDLEGNYLRRGGLFEVIEDAETLVGSVGLYPIDENVCELRKMYFIPAARGQGLGKYILVRMVEQARKLGFKRIVLETSSRLIIANRLYTGFGFTQVDSDHLAERADQAYEFDL